MAGPRIVVDTIASAGPITAAESAINLSGGLVVHLRAGGAAAGYRAILERLRSQARPVYLELGDAGEILRLLLPRRVTVVRVTPLADGDLEVQVDPSNIPHILRRAHPGFDALRAALQSSDPVLLTETDAHEIVDVRRGGRFRAAPKALAGGPGSDGSVSLAQARELFGLAVSCTCDPTTAPAPCIPFLYPDDGCWVRAHAMCRIFVAQGIEPAKIWLMGNGSWLRVTTVNNPNCKLGWFYHVAPTLRVRDGKDATQLYVLDPSLFDAPVTEKEWTAAMNVAKPSATYTPWTWYQMDGRTDPDFEQTEDDLEWLRDTLILRSTGPDGPPPYAQCMTDA